jgi:hypothetical protein
MMPINGCVGIGIADESSNSGPPDIVLCCPNTIVHLETFRYVYDHWQLTVVKLIFDF